MLYKQFKDHVIIKYGCLIFFFFIFFPGISVAQSCLRIATINIRLKIKKDTLNPWSLRKQALFDFIYKEKLDIVCMQEVLPKQLEEIRDAFPNYSIIAMGRKGENNSEAIPVMFDSNVYECLSNGTFWLSQTPDSVGSIGWDAKHPRIATWTILKNKKLEWLICVVNTHLDHVGRNARLEGIKLIKRRMKNIAEEMPVLLCGDMNCSATSQPYYSALNDEFLMYDAYQIAKNRKGVNYSYHAFGKVLSEEKKSMIDHIFVTNQIDVEEINIPKEEKKDGVYLTDHCPVVANIDFLK